MSHKAHEIFCFIGIVIGHILSYIHLLVNDVISCDA